MNNLLAAMEGRIKPAGKDKWLARCVIHDDKDYAMSIKLCDDNSVVAHCFGCGANGLDLYNHLGLDLEELFGKKLERDSLYIPAEIKENYLQDKVVVAIVEEGNINLTLKDKRRHKLAVARIAGIEAKFPHIKG